jgi:hypothetical protein
MPTTKPRYQITETETIARALDLAALRWPDEPRSRLIVRILEESATQSPQQLPDEVLRRRAKIRALAGLDATAYPPGYLAELRADWPE